MTASKCTIDSQAFKVISDHNEAKQLIYIWENKDNIIKVRELDYQILVYSLIKTHILLAFNFIGTTMHKFAGKNWN